MLRNRAALKGLVDRIRASDADLDDEISEALATGETPEWVDEATAGVRALVSEPRPTAAEAASPALNELAPVGDLVEETIVLRMGRPVVTILDGAPQLEFLDAGSETWKTRLRGSAAMLAPAISSIGRVEVSNHPSGLDYMGTGWLIDDGVVATNRHVALTFAAAGGQGYRFLIGFDRKRPVGVDIDFLEEAGNTRQDPVDVVEVLYIAKDNEADVAFLRLHPDAPAPKAKRIGLATSVIPQGSMVAVIGYPARDTRVPDLLLMDRIFGKVYDKKRLAPGMATGVERGSLLHDCTTLGGNSGSPMIDLATGEVCGMHFSGAFLQSNYAVPSPVLARLLADVRGRGGPVRTASTGGLAVSTEDHPGGPATELTVTIPIEVTIRVGGTTIGGATAAPTSAPADTKVTPKQDAASIEDAVAEARRLYGQRPDVLSIEAGWEFTDGWITDRRAVVFAVRSKLAPDDLAAQGLISLPTSVLGVPADIRVARLDDVAPELALEGPAWTSTYQRLPDELTLLAEVNEAMTVTLHASPDAGWAVLAPFLAATKRQLTVGMYDFTAPHIIGGVLDAVRPAKHRLDLVLEAGESLSTGTKKDDIPEAETLASYAKKLGARFHDVPAAVGGTASPFKSAYHIKVAVRDSAAFWLSSGNWQSSNQPAADPFTKDASPPLLSTHNREWHVVVEDKRLAKTFETYLLHDFEQAKAHAGDEAVAPEPLVWAPAGLFQPSEPELEARPVYHPPLRLAKTMRVQPLLTPDNYAGHVEKLIRSATKRVYFQNQSLSVLKNNPAHYEPLIAALADQQKAGLDVRIIIRNIGDVRTTVSRIKDRGFDTDRLRLQTNCHTKGIVVDGRAVMVSSQNWTGDGTGFNRDAGLILFDREAAAYYEELFLYDWGRIGPPRIDESLPAPELADPNDPTPRPGMVLIPLTHWLGET